MNWVEELREHAMPSIVLAIVGNKCDLERERRIDKNQGEELAAKIGAKHFNASAKNSTGIKEIYSYLAKGFKVTSNKSEIYSRKDLLKTGRKKDLVISGKSKNGKGSSNKEDKCCS